jgi:hypothetical protein
MRLGLKFYTQFQDGNVLLTKSFGGTTKYVENVIFQRNCDASIQDLWIEHHNRAVQLEVVGKQVEEKVGFEVFSKIWAET